MRKERHVSVSKQGGDMTKQDKTLEHKITTFMTRKQSQHPELPRYVQHVDELARVVR